MSSLEGRGRTLFKAVRSGLARRRYYPCCEWSQLYEIEMAAGGLKGSFYESMPDSMKPKAKGKRPLNDSTND